MGCTRLFYTMPITLRGQTRLSGLSFALPTPCTLFFTVRVVLKGAILLDNMFSVSEEQRRLFCSAGEHGRSGGKLWRQWEGVPTVLPVANTVIRQPQLVCFCSCISHPSKKGKRRCWNQTPEGRQTFIFALIQHYYINVSSAGCPTVGKQLISGVLHYFLPFSASIYLSRQVRC